MIDATLSSFERDVVEASIDVPVLVYFWAPWSAPAKTLSPLLERLERELGGRFRLVNINSDANPELVGSFNLRRVPYAVAFVDGNAVAQFSGAQPENFVRAFLERLVPNPAQVEHRGAREALAANRLPEAEARLRAAIALDPSHHGARLDLAALLLDRGDSAGARMHFDVLTSRADQHLNHDAVKARLRALEAVRSLPDEPLLERRINAHADDLQARLDLAERCIAGRRWAPACEQLLEIACRDRAFENDIGRRKLIDVFTLAAGEEDLVAAYRSRLSAILFQGR